MGNNWYGTADVVNPQNFKRLKRLNIIPDIVQRRAEIDVRRAALERKVAPRPPPGATGAPRAGA